MSKLILSVSQAPGKGGEKFHNPNFDLFSLDYKYVAIHVNTMKDAITGIRSLGVHGCSVSMPFKEEAWRLVDTLDPLAENVGAVNTILNEGGELKGFNTDVDGALASLRALEVEPDWKVVVLGDGGAARAILQALLLLRVSDVHQYSRKLNNWGARGEAYGELLINATSIGTYPYEQVLPSGRIENFQKIFDLIPHTTVLTADAHGKDMVAIDGTQMKQVQARKQFEIYTGIKL